MKQALRVIIGIMLGIATVPLTQMGVTKIWNLFGIEWGQTNLPVQCLQQAGALSSAFLAGVVGPFVAVLIVRRKALAIWIAFLLIGLTIDIYAALVPMQSLPVWFRIVWVLSVPIQVILGTYLGGLLLKKSE